MEARITFYKINRCGLYARSRKGGPTTAQFLAPAELLADLSQWAIGKDLADTDVFKNSQHKGFCTYLADIQQNAGSYLLVMWNQVPHTDAGVLSLPNNSTVGSIQKADANAIKANSIPGYPTYFWFVPSKNIFATICFSTIVNGRSAMETYIKQFMKMFSKHVVKELDQQTNTLIVKGYSKDPTNAQERIFKYPPTFSSHLYPLPQGIDTLKNRSPEIKKITKKATAEYRTQISKNLYQRALGLFTGIKRNLASSDVFTVKTEVSMPNGLTAEEVQKLYNEWTEDINSLPSLDYGFVIGDEQLWFSHALAKWEGDLALSFTEQNSFGNIGSLLSELESKKSTILSIIN
ncbi:MULTISPECIES: hypothetical protein [Rodentibacter]|uniref:hypothetical protein n=1 Tax=Rodentibacter TaxID=1960084 RepID=UPI001094B240|nr:MULTISPECIES: hypothetical protein [Pasteurellaceae]MCR1838317.1 hypothetical protein [Pasteurella caecimuris]MCU0107572.1 hypothetical protein [Pasteurella caecimuris]NBH76255.1 hypothetical protein [Rodentibacter pneumotropicus]TGY49601.1 hypothetical protein E5343_06345 [Pasteurella caecimuris]THA07166.1 hypothetical protein D3M73_03135 [Rodentibacter pneumotropicus]